MYGKCLLGEDCSFFHLGKKAMRKAAAAAQANAAAEGNLDASPNPKAKGKAKAKAKGKVFVASSPPNQINLNGAGRDHA